MNTMHITSTVSTTENLGADVQVQAQNRGTGTAVAMMACPSGGPVDCYIKAPVFTMQFRGFAGLDCR